MDRIELTGADLSDLAAGFSFNAMAESGEEVAIDGSEFSTAEIAALAQGKEVEYEGFTLTSDGSAWAGHR
jgi:cold shock CspA family protein